MGDVVGSYRIIGKIGEGGMGAVYIAEHTLIGRRAAIKVLLREMSHRQDLVTRFFNKARAATAVKHPGIVEIYDFGYHTDGSAYIVMEYLEGESLSARLRRTGPLPATRAAALGRQVAGALGAAHAKGIVHRDLKPDNIFIVRDPDIANGERTKILDFGIAKLATGEQPGVSMTRTGMVMGTPAYMSPEQSKGRWPVRWGRWQLHGNGWQRRRARRLGNRWRSSCSREYQHHHASRWMRRPSRRRRRTGWPWRRCRVPPRRQQDRARHKCYPEHGHQRSGRRR